MSAKAHRPTDEDYAGAARIGLLGVTEGPAPESIMEDLAALHPRNNTFPAEVLATGGRGDRRVRGVPGRADPVRGHASTAISPEYHFRGKSQQHKSHYALMAAAMIRAGVYPDLLDEAYGWGLEDMWEYAFYALVLYARAGAERTGRSPEVVARAIAERRGVDLGAS